MIMFPNVILFPQDEVAVPIEEDPKVGADASVQDLLGGSGGSQQESEPVFQVRMVALLILLYWY